MKYNMETSHRLVQQLAEMITVVVQQKAGEGTTPIMEIEHGMREALRQIGQQALAMFLSSVQVTPVRPS
jgi:hypothetical protein